MRDIPFSEKKVFEVLDKKALKAHVDKAHDPSVFYESWDNRGIPIYIVIRDFDEYNESWDLEKEGLEGSVDEYRHYQTFDVHSNHDVSTICSWEEYRLEHLLDKGIIKEVGYCHQLDEWERLADEKSFCFNIENHDELEWIGDNL